jgi:hypothetical protein
MASTQSWTEYNGTSPGTATANRTDVNWKTLDDSTATLYSADPVTAGNNSMPKIQCLVFAGTWNSLSAFTYKVSTTAPATGITLVGSVLTAYTQPATSATGDSTTNMTSGIAANFAGTSTPFATGASTASGGGTYYVNAFRTQIQTTTSAGPGDISAITVTAAWTES